MKEKLHFVYENYHRQKGGAEAALMRVQDGHVRFCMADVKGTEGDVSRHAFVYDSSGTLPNCAEEHATFIDKTERCLIQPSDRTLIDRSRACLELFLLADSVRITDVYRVERRNLEEDAEAIASTRPRRRRKTRRGRRQYRDAYST